MNSDTLSDDATALVFFPSPLLLLRDDGGKLGDLVGLVAVVDLGVGSVSSTRDPLGFLFFGSFIKSFTETMFGDFPLLLLED